MKKVMAGFLVGAIVMAGPMAYAETKATIEVIFGQVKLVVNGSEVAQETLLHDGVTYVPLRAAADALGQLVDYDEITKTAYIGEKEASPQTTPTPTPTPPTTNNGKKTLNLTDFAYDIEILQPDSIGTIYMKATYKNSSKYACTVFSLTLLDKAEGEKHYLSSYDTVLPGETSASFKTFGPKSGNENDLEILKTTITVIDDDGEKTRITYDHKLKQFE